MKILSFIEDPEIVKKILESRPPPKARASSPNIHIDYYDSQLPPSDDYLYVDVEYPEVISA